jgi:hypothetical protein
MVYGMYLDTAEPFVKLEILPKVNAYVKIDMGIECNIITDGREGE